MELKLVVLKLDLQMFMPLKRPRVFLFIGQDRENQVVVPQRTWFRHHVIQSGAWSPLFRVISQDLAITPQALKSACDPALLPHEWKNGCIEELLTEKDCLSLRTIGPFHECVGSCMSQYGFQHLLCPRLLRSKGLLSVFMRDGRVRAGIRLIDSLEFAWLLGFSGIKWPRCLRTSFRVLGNCVSPIHARIVNGWIQVNWLGLHFDFDLLWSDLRRINEGQRMLADCQFFQDDEWIRWETGQSSGTLRLVDVQKVGISIQTANRSLFFRVPFHPGLLMHQMLSVVYPCDWSKIDVLFRNSKTLSSLCNGDFHISASDVCILIDGIGWIQISPLAPLHDIAEKVLMQRGIDIRPFQLCIDDGPVDTDVLVAAFLPKNRYYLCDSLHQRFDNFLTPSVKRRRLVAGTFAAQPALVSVNGHACDGICIDIQHSTGSEKQCIRLERGCNYTYLQVVKLALHDFVRPLVCELLQPGGTIDDICTGSFQILLADIRVQVEPFGFEKFLPFDRLSDVINRINLKHFCGKSNLMLRLNGRSCELHKRLGQVNDSLILRILQFDGRGGGPNPQLKQGLQSLLVEHGVPHSESASRANLIWESLGAAKVAAVFATKEPWITLKQEATVKGIQLVTIAERYISDSKTSDDAWAVWNRRGGNKDEKGKGKGKGKGPARTRNGKLTKELLEDTQIDLSFFTDKNGATPQLIGLEALQQGASGICVVTAQEIQHQLDSILKNNLSIEPAALVIIGESDVPLSVGNRCIHKAIPAHISGKPVALSVRILSVSDEAFSMPESKVVAGDQTETSTVVMVQVWKDETRSEAFQVLEKGFVAFLKEQGFEQAKHISQVWSSSFFRQKNRVQSAEATYCVVRVSDKNLRAVLRLSGSAGIYLVPKGPDRSKDDRFRVIPVAGAVIVESAKLRLEIKHHIGLAKLKDGLGVRVEKSRYAETKKLLFPDLPTSDEEDFDSVTPKWFLLGVPDSFDRAAVRKLLGTLGWEGIASLNNEGWRTWSCISRHDPPCKAFEVNGCQIVLSKAEKREQHALFTAGIGRNWRSLAKAKFPGNVQGSAIGATGHATSSVSSEGTRSCLDSLKETLKHDVEQSQHEVKSRVDDFQLRQTKTEERLNQIEHQLRQQRDQAKKEHAVTNSNVVALQKDVGRLDQAIADVPKQFSNHLDAMLKQFAETNNRQLEQLEKRNSEVLLKTEQNQIKQFEDLKALFQETRESKCRKVGDAASREPSNRQAEP